MASPILKLSLLVFLSLFITTGCTDVVTPEPTRSNTTPMCNDEYSRSYETLLRWPEDQDIKTVCDDFYAKFSGVRCISKIDGIELRLHTSDFDKKCGQLLTTPKDKNSNPSSMTSESEHTAHCSSELTSFIIEKQKEFHTILIKMSSNNFSDDSLFAESLSRKKLCNQYFSQHKYVECPVGKKVYSYNLLKPYCDQFQIILHSLKQKNPTKYSPYELKPLAKQKLKFHFEDNLIPFYKLNSPIVDSYLVDGSMIPFGHIASSQNHCHFQSEKIRYAGELKNEIYTVDISYPNKNKILFTYFSFNENWKLICRINDHFYFQDLIETLGDKVSTFE